MARIEPLQALRYNLEKTGGLQDVIAPPYDVIDGPQRAELAARSPYNVVNVDLPQAADDEDPYEHASATFAAWQEAGALVKDTTQAIWVLTQDFTGPDGRQRTRSGFLAAVRVEDYGPGRIRPHERTHPGPKEDRLRLTRATRANLSPIFSLFDDPRGDARQALAVATQTDPWAEATDPDGTVNRLWHVADETAIDTLRRVLSSSELLIADGHHRYETARVYANEIGGEGPHRLALMCLVALQDPGLTVFPTHRLIRGLDASKQEALAQAIRRDFDIAELADAHSLVPAPAQPVRTGYIDCHHGKPLMLRLKDQKIADAALAGHAEPYRHLDTAVLEALILKGTLRMSDEDIDHLDGLGYARDFDDALRLIADSAYDAAFFMAPIPVEQIREVAASGESMPPKSTYFFPKVPTGLVFNPLV